VEARFEVGRSDLNATPPIGIVRAVEWWQAGENTRPLDPDPDWVCERSVPKARKASPVHVGKSDNGSNALPPVPVHRSPGFRLYARAKAKAHRRAHGLAGMAYSDSSRFSNYKSIQPNHPLIQEELGLFANMNYKFSASRTLHRHRTGLTHTPAFQDLPSRETRPAVVTEPLDTDKVDLALLTVRPSGS
jgi:hypothetical protein